MDSKTRLLTAWSFQEPDRVPIELHINPVAEEYPEAERIIEFIERDADNFFGVQGVKWGFCGLAAGYREETIEDVPGAYRRVRRTYNTAAGDFHAITKHSHDELIPQDFLWEKRYIHSIDDMRRLAQAERRMPAIDLSAHEAAVRKIGNRGIALVSLLHPLGWLVRNGNMEEVYQWLISEPQLMHMFLERSNQQVKDSLACFDSQGLGPYFSVTAHEMLIPPWMGMKMFSEFVFPYDKWVGDEIHRLGGKLRIHCHGNCMAYLEKMHAMGVDAIEPLEPAPFGDVVLADAKQKMQGKMLLAGNITSPLFVRMTREDVRQSVRAACSAAARGGGFCLRTTGGQAATNSVKNSEQMRMVLANIEAYIEAALEFGGYPLEV